MTDYVAAARGAARWLDSVAKPEADGLAWPGDPRDPGTVGTAIYQGNAGVVLFYLELFHATGEPHWRDQAFAGGRFLLDRLERAQRDDAAAVVRCGLYDGLAGMGFAFAEIARATGDETYRRAAERCLHVIEGAARGAGRGVAWPTTDPDVSDDGVLPVFAPTDIIGGAAGIGLFLLYARAALGADTKDLAEAAGRRLVEVADSTDAGLDWRPGIPGIDFSLPNFSHGTAGVVYFLASLAVATGAPAYMEAARAGARHLQAIAYREEGVCLVPRTQPPQEAQAVDAGQAGLRPAYSMSWCHGPMGVGATWYRLYQATGERAWLDWLGRSAQAHLPGAVPASVLAQRGLAGQHPERAVCFCHGSAGNGLFLLSAYRATGREAFRQAGVALLDATLERAVPSTDAHGTRLAWPQSLATRDPGTGAMVTEWVPQTGFNTGVAGIGYALLAASALLGGGAPSVILPDSPFGELPAVP